MLDSLISRAGMMLVDLIQCTLHKILYDVHGHAHSFFDRKADQAR